MNLIDVNLDFENNTPCKYSILKSGIIKKRNELSTITQRINYNVNPDGFSIMIRQIAK